MKKVLTTVALLLLVCCSASYASVGWANYQWPCDGASYADNQSIDIYSQAWKDGCTPGGGACADLSATIYYKRASEGVFTSAAMSYLGDVGNNDEYTFQIPAAATESGDPEQYYIIWHDASDNTDYGPLMDNCGTMRDLVVLNITPATEQEVTVTFRVDMACLPLELYSAGVFVAGDFQGWNACTTPLTDPDNDQIYEGSAVFAAGSNPYHEFKFNRNGTDGCQWEGIGNRSFTIDDSGPTQVLDIVPWDNWDCCSPSGPAEITGPGSWCVTVCACDEFLMIPLNTTFNPPIIHTIEFTPGCWEGSCSGNDCTPGSGSPEWYVIHNEQGNWLVLTCLPRNPLHARWGCFCMTIDEILPVDFGSFDAVAGDNEVTLNWNTRSETDNARFDIERDGSVIAQVPSQGNSSTGHNYSWTDRDVANGTSYSYALIAVDINGGRATLATESVTPAAAVITEYSLSANYPNPFNPGTSFGYTLKEAGLVTLNVFDVTGRIVAELVNRDQPGGAYTVTFDGAGLPSGIYYYRLNVNGFSATQKMVLMK